MQDLTLASRVRLAALALALGCLTPTLARAAPSEAVSEFESSEVLRVAEGPVEPEVPEVPDEGAQEPASEWSESTPAIVLVEPPAAVEPPVAASPVPSATRAEPRMVDGRRPKTGAGLIALGAMGMAGSSVLVLTALSGPGWLGLERDRAVLAGGLAVPVGLISAGLLAGGAKAAKRYGKWAGRNQLHPPESGNGMLVAGALITGGMLGVTAYTTQQNLIDPSPSRGAWVSTALAGSASLVGAVVFVAGGVRRSKFAAWERSAYLRPGTMALRGGAGLSVSGRF